jgi:hypothetical protein
MTLTTSCPDGDPFLVSCLRSHVDTMPFSDPLLHIHDPCLPLRFFSLALPVRITLACPGISRLCGILGSTLAICFWELERVLLCLVI